MINLIWTLLKPLQQGLERPHDGVVPRSRILVAYGIPLACGFAIFRMNPTLGPGGLLAGAAIISGVMLSLATMSYNRVKDLAGEDRWDGLDPMAAAVTFARASVLAAQVSVVTSAALMLALLLPACSPYGRVITAAAAAVLLHLFVRIWYLLAMIRHQIGATAGQRAVHPRGR